MSPLVHGAEMRVAETRAVNRALRKAYGIGICSVEEIGSFAEPVPSPRQSKKIPPQPVNGKNRNYGGPKVWDRLCQLIRHHQPDANSVKSYAVRAEVMVAPGHVITIGIYGDGGAEGMFIVGVIQRDELHQDSYRHSRNRCLCRRPGAKGNTGKA